MRRNLIASRDVKSGRDCRWLFKGIAMLFVGLNILHVVSWLNSIFYNYILFSPSQAFLTVTRGCSTLHFPGLDICVAVFRSHHGLPKRYIQVAQDAA